MSMSIPRLNLKSKFISEERKEKLRQLFPEVFREVKIYWERLQLTLGADIETSKERFGLRWRRKAECFLIIQEPSIGTLKPAKRESVDWDTTENHFIEGDNLHTDSTDKEILYEILLKSEFTPTTPVIENKIADKKVYSIDNDTLLICLEHDLTKDLIVKMADIKSVHAKCIYTGFKSNEHIRTTALEIMKSHGVENFRTV